MPSVHLKHPADDSQPEIAARLPARQAAADFLKRLLPAPVPLTPRRLDGTDRWLFAMLLVWTGLVIAAYGAVLIRQALTLGYPVARVILEDQFNSVGDGQILPGNGKIITPALAALFMAPVFWVHQMLYFPLADLLGSAPAITIERWNTLVLHLVGTPLLYRLLRHGRADRWVAFVLSAAYAVSPFALSRMLLCNTMTVAPFLLWSELARIEGRPKARAAGLVAATFAYPLAGFSAVLLALQDHLASSGPQRDQTRRILLVTAAALAVVHFGVLVLWPWGQPSLTAGKVTFDGHNLSYPVFPYRLGPLLAMPVKLFEIAVFIGGSCIYLLAHPTLLFPAVVDVVYWAGTGKGVRDHTMLLSTVALLPILGVRHSLFTGGSRARNRALVGACLAATVYGHVLAAGNGFIQMALVPDPPRPHLADVEACIPPDAKRCLALPFLYSGYPGRCEQVVLYEPKDLPELRIDDPSTVLFVPPLRLNQTPKARPYESPERIKEILGEVAARVRSGEWDAGVCAPGLVRIRTPGSGSPDAAAIELLERASR
jgi:hypothetical protein